MFDRTIEKLRKLSNEFSEPRTRDYFEDLLTGLIADVSEEFMELPTDADGVTIRLGEMVKWDDRMGNVTAIGSKSLCIDGDSHIGNWVDPKRVVHYKPTVEDILDDIVSDLMGKGFEEFTHAPEVRKIIKETYAPLLQIREDA